eukprot:gene16679-16859_t
MVFRLAHLSDAHIGPLPLPKLAELFGKRLTGFLNWHNGRYLIHDMKVLAALVADLRLQQVDHCAMTGDILNIGLRAEFPPAKRWLETLGTPADVSFVPGNHDVYVRSNMALVEEYFGSWMRSDTPDVSPMPYLRLRGNVALIGLSSGVPTAPFLASGRLGKAQMAAFALILGAPELQDFARVVMIHHPPYLIGARFGRGLMDAQKFEKIIAKFGAELIIHGHNHRESVHYLPGPRGDVPVVGVASASAVPGSPQHLAAYHVYSIEKQSAGWHITAMRRGLKSGDARVHDLGALDLSR